MSFDETKHPRGHHTNPGRFSEKSHSEPEVTLGAPAPNPVVDGFELDIRHLPNLPAWPAGLPEPAITWGYGEEGTPEVTVNVGDDSFWVSHHELTGYATSLFDGHDEDVPDWDEATKVEADVWGTAVLGRVRSLTGDVEYQATSGDRVGAAISALAAGKPVARQPTWDRLNDAFKQYRDALDVIHKGSAKQTAEEILALYPNAHTLTLDESDLERGYLPEALLDEHSDRIADWDGDTFVPVGGGDGDLEVLADLEMLTRELPRLRYDSDFPVITADNFGHNPRLNLRDAAALNLD